MNCRPIGSSSSTPQGTLIAGCPVIAIWQVLPIICMAYITFWSGGSGSVGTGVARNGTVGRASTSKRSRARS